MYALTLKQPWAHVVAHGSKRVENRSWPVPRTCPLPFDLAIHAGSWSGWDKAGEFSPLVIKAWREWGDALPYPNITGPLRRYALHIDFSAVLAVATVIGCHRDCAPACSEWAMPDQWHWVLTDVRTLAKPVPCGGHQKLWPLPEEAESAVRAQLEPPEPPMDTPEQVADELFRRAFGRFP